MAELNGHQKSELKACARSIKPLWHNCPPETADGDLRIYLFHDLVRWTGTGYVITPKGLKAITEQSE